MSCNFNTVLHSATWVVVNNCAKKTQALLAWALLVYPPASVCPVLDPPAVVLQPVSLESLVVGPVDDGPWPEVESTSVDS